MPAKITRTELDALYKRYNKKRFVSPDPLEFLYRYPTAQDREVAGLIAACLAYGRVAQILRSVAAALDPLGASPAAFVRAASPATLRRTVAGFRHRFAGEHDLFDLLKGIRSLIRRYDSLHACFLQRYDPGDETVLPALSHFVDALGCREGHLVPSPDKGSACKRLHLYLRWMVRKDAVDPGGWAGVSKRHLIIPLDTHMARIGRHFKMTGTKTPGLRMALDVTAAFRTLCPEDPVRYDFALTRFGIRDDLSMETMLETGAGMREG